MARPRAVCVTGMSVKNLLTVLLKSRQVNRAKRPYEPLLQAQWIAISVLRLAFHFPCCQGHRRTIDREVLVCCRREIT